MEGLNTFDTIHSYTISTFAILEPSFSICIKEHWSPGYGGAKNVRYDVSNVSIFRYIETFDTTSNTRTVVFFLGQNISD